MNSWTSCEKIATDRRISRLTNEGRGARSTNRPCRMVSYLLSAGKGHWDQGLDFQTGSETSR